jgi:hypothetical protein
VCGLPDPRNDHAVAMAKFANECMIRLHDTTRILEVELGPDTAELGLRVGLHSGPVVAGVLRGDKSRFQLFGDSMNTASRMESTGVRNRIQLSQETADLLLAANKGDWITRRETKVEAKGKGELQTYFLRILETAAQKSDRTSSTNGDSSDNSCPAIQAEAQEKRNRGAEWTVDVLASILKDVVESRLKHGIRSDPRHKIEAAERNCQTRNATAGTGQTVIDEVADCIVLPDYEACHEGRSRRDSFKGALDENVMKELRNFVQTISSLYNTNSFHNFDHANHVVMSVNKLLGRIVAPDMDSDAKRLHDHTYGITSDPLTWFAVVFAALIHDVDHAGVPNAQLVQERAPVAALYRNKSVAEQNSVDLSWNLLMEPSYKALRNAIYTTVCEFKRFRQLVVSTVMATDIMDGDLKQQRNHRWETAFGFDDSIVSVNEKRSQSLKATIVLEHLIQASDVAHTMQHWHIYRKWNDRFFEECYAAYLQGRADTNPAETWYKGELGFFDFYIIPLAKKLKECGVFGVSSDEYLSYALQNRKEWEERGLDIVQQMVASKEAGSLPSHKASYRK